MHARLQQSDARVADVGRGYGWSSVAIAEANPNVAVDGYDFAAPSSEAAQAIAAERGLADRLHFHTADISDGDLAHSYDLVTVFEALHDMARPVEALQTMRALLRDGGHVLVMDERVGETFTGHPDDIERMMYGWSTLLCLPNTLAESPSAATGTVIRESTLRQYATDAGFTAVELLPIENDFFRFYLLTP